MTSATHSQNHSQFCLDPPTISRGTKPVVPPRVDRTKKPSSTLPPRFDESGMFNGMPVHKYYNILDDPTANYSSPPPPRPSHNILHSSISFDNDTRYNNCASTSNTLFNSSTSNSIEPIKFDSKGDKLSVGNLVQLQLDLSGKHFDNTRPVPPAPQSSHENSSKNPSASPYENSSARRDSNSSVSSSLSNSSKVSYENDDAFAEGDGEIGYSNVPRSLVRKLSLTMS